MGQSFKEVAAIRTNIENFHKGLENIEWSEGFKESRECKDCEGSDNPSLCDTCNSVGCNFKRKEK